MALSPPKASRAGLCARHAASFCRPCGQLPHSLAGDHETLQKLTRSLQLRRP